MDSLQISALTVACSVAGFLIGIWVRNRLPDHHIRDDAKDVIKNATGMIATLVALVIGLLVSTSKSTFDSANDAITQNGARTIMLDSLLARYGPEAAEARTLLRQNLAEAIERVWPAEGPAKVDSKTVGAASSLEAAYDRIRLLAPTDDPRKTLQSQSLSLCSEIMQSRWLIIENAQGGLPPVFLALLIAWLAVLFIGLGLQTPNSLTAKFALFVCAASMAAALFLILEMSRPMEGLIKVSPAPLLKAQALLGK